MSTMPKEVKALLKTAEQQGFTWTMNKKNHCHIRNTQGALVAICGGTPSDTRAIKNLRADLRRAGVTGI